MGEENYEIGYIKKIRDKEKHSFWWGSVVVVEYWALVRNDEVIARTDMYEHIENKYDDKNAAIRKQLSKARDLLIEKLMNDGWEVLTTEVLTTSEGGGVVSMRRRVGKTSEKQPTASKGSSNVELLQQLANLRDAGILTEEEFETKKAEILKQI